MGKLQLSHLELNSFVKIINAVNESCNFVALINMRGGELEGPHTKEECHAILGAHTKKLVVFIFTAEWCPHSVELKANLETLAKEDQHVVLVNIDVDYAEDLIPFYSLYAVPSFYFFKNNEEIGTQVGGDYAKLRSCIRKFKRMKETE